MKKAAALVSLWLGFAAVMAVGNADGFAGAGSNGAASPEGATLKGKVLETMDGGEYTYLQLERGTEKKWVAIPRTRLRVGDEVELPMGNEMGSFTSKSLKRTFDSIMFTGAPVDRKSTADDQEVQKAHAGMKKAEESKEPVKVEKAAGPDGKTIAEILKAKGSLAGKQVAVRGKVVKISEGIMERNWVHLRDGSSGDKLVVTTSAAPKMGDVVTLKGKISVDRDFGGGYRYAVIMEEATLVK